ncbi:MAG: carbon-nitrogen hydrolase family protein [Thermoflavifilum sp.]|nr:carbon-nitrogen hydrolase family protein [Thermoflavifilum sp.]
MPADTYPRFKVAVVQAAPVFLDRDATIEKLDRLVAQASSKGAELVVFGESFIPAFPVWNIVYAPIDQHWFFRTLFDNAVEIPSPHFNKICNIASKHGVYLSVGITEKGSISMGAMWNTNLLIDPKGRLLNRHRKLVPTWAEKLTWANGDASYLRVEHTDIGRLGVLICGENTNTLSRFALLAQGEQVHIATYPPAWPFRRPGAADNYNLTDAIRIRSAAHAFEGKVFNIIASCVLDEQAIDVISQDREDVRSLLQDCPKPVSMVIGPTGNLITEVLEGTEGILVADIDVAQSIEHKQAHDIVGYYNRFDIYDFRLNAMPNVPIRIKREEPDAVTEPRRADGTDLVSDVSFAESIRRKGIDGCE